MRDWHWWFTRSERAWLALISAVIFAVVLIALACSGQNWPSVLGTFTAAGIAAYMGWSQSRQARLVEYLTFLPILTGSFGDHPNQRMIEIHNVGNGPAMDLRVTLLAFRGPDSDTSFYALLPAELTRSHLGARERATARRMKTGDPIPNGTNLKYRDVWIIHCRDLRARDYHLVSNSTERGDPGDAEDSMWRWFGEGQGPEWLARHCRRCLELAGDRTTTAAASEQSLVRKD